MTRGVPPRRSAPSLSVREREAAVGRLLKWMVNGKLAHLLLQLVDNFGEEKEHGTAVEVRWNHNGLSYMVASRRQAVSKVLS